MPKGHLEHVNITVSDIERSATLLQQLLGWRIRWRGPSQFGGETIHVGSDEDYIAVYTKGAPVPRFAKVDRALITLRSPSPNTPSASAFGVRVAYELSGTPEPFSAAADFPARKWSVPFDNGGGSYNAKGSLDNGLITIDVTDLPLTRIGDEVELWGDQVSVDDVARHCATISYELFCRMTMRPARSER